MSTVLETDREFFDALLAPSCEVLDRLLTDDFLLIDVVTGSEVSKPAMLDLMASSQLSFDSIEPDDRRVRIYGPVAVVTGRTEMRGKMGEMPFVTRSRYTHVFVQDGDRWMLASAQGTLITAAS
jgi:hypothetical protein